MTSPARLAVHPDKGSARRSLAEIAHREILDRILDFTFEPGTVVAEQKLGDLLGMSRTPIREALDQLEEEGLIHQLVGRGAMVKELTARELAEIFEFREAIETFAVLKPALRVDAGVHDKLDAIFQYFMTHQVSDDPVALRICSEADEQLHRSIVASLANRLVLKQFDRLRLRIVQMRSMAWTKVGQLEAICAEHREIIAALTAGQNLHCAELIRQHLRRGRDHQLSLLQGGVYPHGRIQAPSHLVEEWLARSDLRARDMGAAIAAALSTGQ